MLLCHRVLYTSLQLNLLLSLTIRYDGIDHVSWSEHKPRLPVTLLAVGPAPCRNESVLPVCNYATLLSRSLCICDIRLTQCRVYYLMLSLGPAEFSRVRLTNFTIFHYRSLKIAKLVLFIMICAYKKKNVLQSIFENHRFLLIAIISLFLPISEDCISIVFIYKYTRASSYATVFSGFPSTFCIPLLR